MEIAITVAPIAEARLGRVLDAMRARNPDLKDSHYLSFIFELGLLEAERLYSIKPRRPGKPAGIYAAWPEEGHDQ